MDRLCEELMNVVHCTSDIKDHKVCLTLFPDWGRVLFEHEAQQEILVRFFSTHVNRGLFRGGVYGFNPQMNDLLL